MSLKLRPLSAALGAEIMELDLTGSLDAGTAAELYQAWLDHVILLFRGQNLSQQDLLDVSAYFGTVGRLARPAEERPAGYKDLLDNVMLISNVRQDGEPIGALPDGDMMFHHDMLHADMPHKATLLYSVEVPREGGNTLFANLYSAYEKLPDEVRAPLEGKTAFHHYHYGTTHKDAGGGTRAFSDSRHPVFRTHGETGRKAIFVNRLMTERVEEIPRGESDALLAKLFDHSEQPEFVYEHLWRPGDLIVWDNRCSMHGRTDFSPLERRLFWRTTVEDTEAPR